MKKSVVNVTMSLFAIFRQTCSALNMLDYIKQFYLKVCLKFVGILLATQVLLFLAGFIALISLTFAPAQANC